MDKPIDMLESLRIRFEDEKKNGDLSEAARMAKVSMPNASTGIVKSLWKDLTKSERKAMICLRKILDKRKEEELEMANEQNL